MSIERETAAVVLPEPNTVLDWTAAAPVQGTLCALLTPAIKVKLREMEPGQVLEVRVNDMSARDDIVSWCRLSGHELLALTEQPPDLLRAYVRKKRG
jgi:tRNA 2-thiouridine synthesizing protein A